MLTIEQQNKTETKLKRIAWLSLKDPNKEFHQLMHHFTEDSLESCFHKLDGRKAVGIDRVSKARYGKELSENLKELIERMKRMGYRPGPVRQVLIPKEGKPGASRPLGISNFEDKLIQKRMQEILESIYEPLFLNCSYGFRPGRSCHGAIEALQHYLYRNEVETVIDIDLANFFGTIDHKELEAILREKIKDEKFMRYIIRMFKAGVLTNNELNVGEGGVPQGSICSPILSNIFAHTVIDKWIEERVKRHCRGRIEIFRYADDMVICCQYKHDAERVKEALGKRLEKYKLKLNMEKTKLISFSKKQYNRGDKQGVFDFLGFTFYWGRTRKGQATPKLKTNKKRFRAKLKKINEWAKMVRNRYPLKQIWKLLEAKVRGHLQYYGVSHNIRSLEGFMYQVERIMFRWLNRRSQKRSFNWENFQKFTERNPLPKARICHKLF